MTPLNNESYKELVLIGGGHTHALFLSMWAEMPIPGVRITLISPDVMTPYSGMLPGLIAGHFQFEETHIDLARLCQFAGARFIRTFATLIEPSKNIIHLQGRPHLHYDLLSINCGTTPNLDVPGAREFAIGVKPISNLYKKWQSLVDKLAQHKDQAINLTVVGGGVAGVEFSQALQHRLQNNPNEISITILQKGQGLPESFPAPTQAAIQRRLNLHNIEVLDFFKVIKIEKTDQERLRLYAEAGQTHTSDHIFWCTHATGSSWLRQSNLPLSEDGFLTTNDYLQVEKHTNIFATGDCAIQLNHPRPRAGVFAVRQAHTLNINLRARLLDKPLRPHTPQKYFLSLITGGDQWAVAVRGRWPLPNLLPAAIWNWKRNIDQAFMKKLSPTMLPQMPQQEVATNIKPESHRNHDMRCGGCGAKVGQQVLNQVIDSLQASHRDGIKTGLDQKDDAASFTIPAGVELVQSVDVLKQLVSDPFLQGQIAAEHALSDLFAMHSTPHSAQAIVTLPIGSEIAALNDLRQLMAGALKVLNRHNCTLIGGHTSEGPELSIGFCVNGLNDKQRFEDKTPEAGDTLILTKPLGTGVLFAAHSQLGIGGAPIETAISAMLQSNREAAEIFRQHQALELTDVTGFGLAGHLLQLLGSSSASVCLSALPTLPGTDVCFKKGFTSSLHTANLNVSEQLAISETSIAHRNYPALFDPQTSGGLVAIVRKEKSGECVSQLQQAGYKQAAIIGQIENTAGDSEKQIRIDV